MSEDRRELVRFAAVLLFGGTYLALMPLVVAKVSDFGHLWTAGHVVGSDATGMYDAEAHRPVVLGLVEGATLWNDRASEVGVYFYPPTADLWYALLGFLPYPAACVVQGLVTLVAVGVAAVSVARLSAGRLAPATVAVIILASPTCLYAYALGQNGVMTLAVAAVGALLLSRDRDGFAGAVLSLLAMKPSWTLGLGWLPVVLARWKAVASFVGGALLAALIAAALFGPMRFVEYVHIAELVARLDRLPNYPLMHQHNLFALARSAFGVGVLTDAIGTCAGVAVVALTAWRFARRPVLTLEATGAFFAAGTLANPHVHHYDMLPMCVAIAAIAASFPETTGRRIGAIVLVAFWYAAFFIGETLVPGFSVPAVANLAVWAWLLMADRVSFRR